MTALPSTTSTAAGPEAEPAHQEPANPHPADLDPANQDPANQIPANPIPGERTRRGPIARVLLAVIGVYRTAIGPALPPSCRYTPSCSAYAVEAIEVHGAGRGSWLAVRRILRCHPFHAGGHDPVPPPVPSAGSIARLTNRSARPAAKE